jgi:hypothetical protein
MVLRLVDAPPGFVRTSGKYVSNAQLRAKKPRGGYDAALGRLTGYGTTFTKNGGAGLLEIHAEASRYRSVALAHASFLGGAKVVEAEKFRRTAVGASLGNEARLYKTTSTEGRTEVDVYVVVWRSGALISTVLGAGVAGTVVPRDVVALATKQQARVTAATR